MLLGYMLLIVEIVSFSIFVTCVNHFGGDHNLYNLTYHL